MDVWKEMKPKGTWKNF